jgi:hypothetical protein
MKTTQSSGTRPVHQTVAEGFEFKSGGKAIAIEFTDQRPCPQAGTATFWSWLRSLDWVQRLTKALPHCLPTSNNHLLPIEKALAFMHGMLWNLQWTVTEVPGTEVAELDYQGMSWPHPRRLVLIRHRVREDESRGGKRLLDVPGYRFQALVTSLSVGSHPPLAVWRYYNGRADCENVIKELREGFALPTLCPENFWATEAALSLAVLTYNLSVSFQRHLGWQQKVTIHSLRFWLFVTAGVLSHPGGKTTIKLAVPQRERGWWRRLWEKILSSFPNCNAVENRPTFNVIPMQNQPPTASFRLRPQERPFFHLSFSG